MYQMSARFTGMEFVGVPTHADFSLDMRALLAAIAKHRPALLFVANPNNPTGNWVDQADLIRLVQAMEQIGLVVADEAYHPFAPGSLMQELPRFDNLVVMRTTSKLGWAGLRLGYMSAAAPVLEAVEKLRPPYNVNVLTEAAAEFLLDHMDLFDQQASQIRTQRSKLIASLQQFPQIEVFPSSANFVLIRVLNAEQIFTKLLDRKILVKNVGKMHALLSNCLRVTVSTEQENQQFLDALTLALK
jgi:histidinol-phosphate aminotransferase